MKAPYETDAVHLCVYVFLQTIRTKNVPEMETTRLASPEVQQFLRDHATTDPAEWLLRAPDVPPSWPRKAIAEQLTARQKARKKLPTWYDAEGIVFPTPLSVEQASSERLADYKARLLAADWLVDLTGGLGVDSFYFARHVRQVNYVERDPEKVQAAAHNFQKLGAATIRTHTSEAAQFLKTHFPQAAKPVFYLDPARRAETGRVFRLEDCQPDVVQLQAQLLAYGREVWIKTAPMLDLSAAQRALREVAEILVISEGTDCREVVYILRPDAPAVPDLRAVHLPKTGAPQELRVPADTEARTPLRTGAVQEYVYLPAPAMTKAGLFRTLSARFDAPQLHQHAHVYTSPTYRSSFPGRHFQVLEVLPFSRKKLQRTLHDVSAHVLTRHFPMSVAELRRSFGITDGTDDYLLFTTQHEQKRVVLKMRRVEEGRAS